MDIHERLTETARLVKEYNKLLHRQESINNTIEKERKNRDELKKKLIAEGRDLKRLDGIGLLNLWYNLKGTKEEVRRKEEEEYLVAKLKYDEAKAAVEALEEELKTIKQKITARINPEKEYQQALKAKEEHLLRSSGPAAKCILELDEQMGCLQAEAKEIEEAIDVGQKAYDSLSKVISSLNSARGWGAIDILGGGLLITAVKHTRINDAQREIQHAQEMLHRFKRELADVEMEHTVNIGGVSTAADFLLDGLLFDLIVQSQINTARDRTIQTKEMVCAAINSLRKMKENNQAKYQEIIIERNRIIENS